MGEAMEGLHHHHAAQVGQQVDLGRPLHRRMSYLDLLLAQGLASWRPVQALRGARHHSLLPTLFETPKGLHTFQTLRLYLSERAQIHESHPSDHDRVYLVDG